MKAATKLTPLKASLVTALAGAWCFHMGGIDLFTRTPNTGAAWVTIMGLVCFMYVARTAYLCLEQEGGQR